MERDAVNRYNKYNTAIRNREGLGEDEGLHFFVDPQEQGANVMTSQGDVHDYYDDPEDARKDAEALNAKYGKVDEDMQRILKLAGLYETASGGATAAGAVATGAAAVGGQETAKCMTPKGANSGTECKMRKMSIQQSKRVKHQ